MKNRTIRYSNKSKQYSISYIHLTMEASKIPEFIDTPEKYNQVVRDTDTIEKYEDIFYKLLEDKDLSLVELLKIMYKFEQDVILYHQIPGVKHLMEMADSLIRYMISTARQEQYKKDLRMEEYLDELENLVDKDVTCDCPERHQ